MSPFVISATGRTARISPASAWAACLALCAAWLVGQTAAGREAAPPAAAEEVSFLRVARDAADHPTSLDTAIVSYAESPAAARRAGRREPIEIDLVGAVHIGSRDYYDMLNRCFTNYDSVLYELVAAPGARVPKQGHKPAGVIGSAQHGLTQLLGLEFQLDRIDYTADNFVHADLSPREFSAAMAKRGESWWTMFSRLMREGMARAEAGDGATAEVGIGDMFSLLFGSGPQRQLKLRRLMAEQFSDMDVLSAAFGGEEGSTLITDRNTAALEVLRRRIAKGDRRIAIFYGAGHMDDFDRRLRADFDVQPRDTVWIEAWDLRDPAPAPRR
ncbi:hypothetical protein EBR04_08520 [bacterium]|nr:hypothetical protein [bacterium]